MPEGRPAVRARALGKLYRVWTHSQPTNVSERLRLAAQRLRGGSERPHRDVWAFRDVSFEVHPGEVFGVLGANGVGKSSLLAVLARITEPTEGEAELYGRVSSLLEVGTGFHPELTGRDNVYLNAAALGMSKRETARKFDEIVDFSGVRDFIDIPVKRYSTGMYMRLAFAVAAHVDPEILLLDEILSVGDQAFQEKSLQRIEDLTRAGRAVLFVSHDANSVARLCQRAIVLGAGGVEFDGPVDDALEHYLGSRRVVHSQGRLDNVEREGTGEARFMEVRIAGAEGDALVADQPIEVSMTFAAPAPLAGEHLELEIGIASASGGQLANLSTRFDPTQPLVRSGIEHGTTIACVIDELPLKPGHYSLSLSLNRLGESIDRVAGQIEFSVLPSDFFGTGILPRDQQGPVLVRHRWHIGEPVVSAAENSP